MFSLYFTYRIQWSLKVNCKDVEFVASVKFMSLKISMIMYTLLIPTIETCRRYNILTSHFTTHESSFFFVFYSMYFNGPTVWLNVYPWNMSLHFSFDPPMKVIYIDVVLHNVYRNVRTDIALATVISLWSKCENDLRCENDAYITSLDQSIRNITMRTGINTVSSPYEMVTYFLIGNNWNSSVLWAVFKQQILCRTRWCRTLTSANAFPCVLWKSWGKHVLLPSRLIS